MHEIAKVKMTLQNRSSNKYYDVIFYLKDNGQLVLNSEYGRIGTSPKNGVAGTFSIDAAQEIQNGKIGALLQKLVLEADVIVQTKLNKGYSANGKKSFDVSAMRNSLERILNVSTPAAAPKQAKQPSFAVIQVEVVDMVCGVPKVAKVLADFNYELLGDALNPTGKTVRVGDIIDVYSKNNRWLVA